MGCDWYDFRSNVVNGFGYKITTANVASLIEEANEISARTGMKWVGVPSILKSYSDYNSLKEEIEQKKEIPSDSGENESESLTVSDIREYVNSLDSDSGQPKKKKRRIMTLLEKLQGFVGQNAILGKGSFIIFYQNDILSCGIDVPGPYEIDAEYYINKISFTLLDEQSFQEIKGTKFVGNCTFLVCGTADNFVRENYLSLTHNEHALLNAIETDSENQLTGQVSDSDEEKEESEQE